MKTKYKHIQFEKAPPGLGWIWSCYNNKTNELLGDIDYYKSWRQYVIEFQSGCVFNNQCLRDIADFLDQINKEVRPK